MSRDLLLTDPFRQLTDQGDKARLTGHYRNKPFCRFQGNARTNKQHCCLNYLLSFGTSINDNVLFLSLTLHGGITALKIAAACLAAHTAKGPFKKHWTKRNYNLQQKQVPEIKYKSVKLF